MNNTNDKKTIGVIVAIIIIAVVIVAGVVGAINYKHRIEEQNKKRIFDAIQSTNAERRAKEEQSNKNELTTTSKADNSSADSSKVDYEEISKETYDLEDNTVLELALYQDKNSDLLLLSAHVTTADFEAVKITSQMLFALANAENKYDRLSLLSTIDETMVLSYEYSFSEDSFILAFGMEREDVTSTFKLGLPDWITVNTDNYQEQETLRYANLLTSTSDAYNEFVKKYVN